MMDMYESIAYNGRRGMCMNLLITWSLIDLLFLLGFSYNQDGWERKSCVEMLWCDWVKFIRLKTWWMDVYECITKCLQLTDLEDVQSHDFVLIWLGDEKCILRVWEV